MERSAPETQYVKTADGVYIAYQVFGDGPIDLVSLDGWVMPLEARWEIPVVAAGLERLSSFARVISFDKRGVGLSDPVAFDVGSTLEEWIDDVATVMDAVNSDRAALLGHHDGGWPAMLFAAAHPERVSHLVLVNTTARIARDEETPWGIPVGVLGIPLDRIAEYGTANAMHYVPDEVRAWWGRARRHQASPGTFIALMEMQWQVDLRSVLPTIKVKTLVVHSAENRFWRVGHGRYLGEHIDGATLLEVPGSDHHWQLGDSGAVIDEIGEFVTGTRPAPVSDRVLATVLFTDIVGSTPRVAAMGDRPWRDLLDRYETVVRSEIARHKGQEIFTKGDEFLVTFDGPARAVRCAQAIRVGAANFDLAVRSGVHTGEIELRGDDVAGIAVHIGARIMGAAQPDEILVSRTVTDLTAGSGLQFEDRGEHNLKGVDKEWQLFAVK